MKHWLRCTISPGQFSAEYAVQGQAFDSAGFSLFAPEELVDFEEPPTDQRSVPGWLRVEVFETRDGMALVRLPREALGAGRFVTVKADQLCLSLEKGDGPT